MDMVSMMGLRQRQSSNGAGVGKWDALDSVSMFPLRAVRALMPRFVAAFHRNSGQEDRVRRSWRRG